MKPAARIAYQLSRRGLPAQRPPQRDAFTLIEVILAMGLSITLLAMLSWSIGLYLTRVDTSRSEVEQSQIARGVMRLIADDLRSAATTFVQDTSSTEELAESQAQFDTDEIDETDDSTEEDMVTRRPLGVYGDAQQIQIDINKARPVDPVVEFGSGEQQIAPATLLGVTTVGYFVTAEGLARQEVVREVALWEADQGSGSSADASTRIIAPEVAQITLLYSDGQQTLQAWNTEEQGGLLPVAIEVQIAFRQPQENALPNSDPSMVTETYHTYRMVVALPTSYPPVEEEEEEEDPNAV